MENSQVEVSALQPGQLFDSIGVLYDTAFDDRTEQDKSINWLLEQLSPGSKVLDIGCGPGYVAAKISEAGHDVLGIDVSEVMISAAKKQAPAARFEKSDFLHDFSGAPESYDAVAMYFALISDVSRADIKEGMRKVYTLLKKGGVFGYSNVAVSGDRVSAAFLGRPCTASGYNAEETVEMLQNVGFEIERHTENLFQPKWVEGLCRPEHVSKEPQVFVYARKNA